MSIDYVVHLADVHIRAGDMSASRYTAYSAYFDNLAAAIRTATIDRKYVIVIAGDLFHDKTRHTACSIKLFNLLVEKMTSLAPTFIIQGNHDFQQQDRAVPDSITAALFGRELGVNGPHYLMETGLYAVEDIVFGVLAIGETLSSTDGSSKAREIPAFPDAREAQARHKIALFHGAIRGSVGLPAAHDATNPLTAQWIADGGYDIAMLGDIHIRQVHTCENFVWAYSGSCVQQNFGEQTDGHGFILWDLARKAATCIDVEQPELRATVGKKRGLFITNSSGQVPIAEFKAMHKNSRILLRFSQDLVPDDVARIRELFGEESCPRMIVDRGIVASTGGVVVDISQHGAIESLTRFIASSAELNTSSSDVWARWIKNPETAFVSSALDDIGLLEPPQKQLAFAKRRDAALANMAAKFASSDAHRCDRFCIRKVEWDWILCYDGGNSVEFDRPGIYVISGPNSIGKSSLLEIILLGMFGESAPSRYDKQHSDAIICNRKPPGELAQIRVTFACAGAEYRIERGFTTRTSRLDTIVSTLSRVQGNEIIATSITTVRKWVAEHVGTIDQFLLSCIITQTSDNDFLRMPGEAQIALIDETLHINRLSEFKEYICDAINATAYVLEQCSAFDHAVAPTGETSSADHEAIREAEAKTAQDSARLSELRGTIGKLHGNMSDADANAILAKFDAGALDLAVAARNTDRCRETLCTFGQVPECPREFSEAMCAELRDLSASPAEVPPNVGQTRAECLETIRIARVDDPTGTLGESEVRPPDYKNLAAVLGLLKPFGVSQRGDCDVPQDLASVSALVRDSVTLHSKLEGLSYELDAVRKLIAGADIDEARRLAAEKFSMPDIAGLQALRATSAKLRATLNADATRRSEILADFGALIGDTAATGADLASLDTLPTTQEIDDARHIREKLATIQRELAGIDAAKIPFNDKCASCRAQPWRIRRTELVAEMTAIQQSDVYVSLAQIESRTEARRAILAKYRRGDIPAVRERIAALVAARANLADIDAHIAEATKDLNATESAVEDLLREANEYAKKEEHRQESARLVAAADSAVRLTAEHREVSRKVERVMSKIGSATFAATSRLEEIRVARAKYQNFLAARAVRRIAEIDKYERAMRLATLKYWRAKFVQNARESLVRNEAEREIAILTARIAATSRSLGEMSARVAQADMRNGEAAVNAAVVAALKRRLADLREFATVIGNFRIGMYNRIAESLCSCANGIVATATHCDAYEIHAEVVASRGAEVRLEWYVKGPSGTAVFRKEGGFRQFIFGLATRIAFARIGASQVSVSQIFIDEGFVAADAANLDEMREFLMGLAAYFGDGVVLISHLQAISECGDFAVCINRHAGLSHVGSSCIAKIQAPGTCGYVTTRGKKCSAKALRGKQFCGRHSK